MKLELHEHISRLLYDHDCVVVPDFGAFITRYYPAEINHATHMMRPPSRRVYFNANIRENDGLLAKSVGYLEQTTYKNAMRAISIHRTEWKRVLESGKKVKLAGIGRLYLDDSKNLQFSPSLEINYQRASYGLSIFRSAAIQREAEILKTINKAIEKHVVVEHTETDKRKVAGWVSWAAVLGPVILASAIGYSYFSTAPQKFESLSGFNPLAFSRSISVDSPSEVDETTASYIEEENEAADKSSVVENDYATDEAEEIVADITPSEIPVESKTIEVDVPLEITGHYHIIVGSFKEQKNASQYVAELRAKGYEAYLAEGDNSFNRVAIGNYNSESSARSALNGVKQNVHPQSWIYAN